MDYELSKLMRGTTEWNSTVATKKPQQESQNDPAAEIQPRETGFDPNAKEIPSQSTECI